MKKLDALNDFVLVAIDRSEHTTEGGMVVPNSEGGRADAIALRGTVVSIGPEVTGHGGNYDLGDTVMIPKFEANLTRYSAIEYAFVKAEWVMGVLSSAD